MFSRGKKRAVDLRRAFADRFAQRFSRTKSGEGLINTKKFLGYPLQDQVSWGLAQFLLATVARKTTGGALKPPVKEAWLEDCNPPATFLVSLDAPAERMWTDEAGFFANGSVIDPTGLAEGWHPPQELAGGKGMFSGTPVAFGAGEVQNPVLCLRLLAGGLYAGTFAGKIQGAIHQGYGGLPARPGKQEGCSLKFQEKPG